MEKTKIMNDLKQKTAGEGKIIQIVGPVVDVEFSEDVKIPKLGNALVIDGPSGKIVLEVAKHLESGKVRSIALASTDGLSRGAGVSDTGDAISVLEKKC